MPARLPTAFLCAALSFAGAHAWAGDIVRCVSASGTVTYQQVACPEAAREQVTGITNEYPPVNMAERERIFAREAEMYRRLEAERERLSREAAMREARAATEARAREAEAAAAAATEPYYVAWPARPARPVHHQRGHASNQPVWTGGNPLSPGFSR